IHYHASGDWHRVDHRSGQAATDGTIWLGEHVRMFADYTRNTDQGFWLTNRIGNRNLTVQTTVSGVQSPRDFTGHEATLGRPIDQEGWRGSVSVDWLDDHTRARWMFSQPATANPAFTESEDFASNSTLHGPGGRVSIGNTTAPFTF